MTHAFTDSLLFDERLAALQEHNRELARQIAELRAHDALKTKFLSNISHDLRTPLTAIITHAEILRDGILGSMNERQTESLAGIISGGHQLLDMVNEILTYARGADNQLIVTRSEFTVASLIEQVRALNESLVAKKGHSLTTEVEADLPTLCADREKIAHVLGNLLGNAIAFTPPGGRVWIIARLGPVEGRGPTVQVEVGDTGIGIAAENHDLVFHEFAQVDASASRRHHGTGLGLAIARKFVELHDGRIWLESALGVGSRFFFTIPVRDLREPCPPTS